MQKIILLIMMIVVMATKLSAQESGSYKKVLDWSYWQHEPVKYEMNFEKDPESADQNIFTIKSVQNKVKGFGSLGKGAKPNLYQDKKLKMTAYVKTENVSSWAGLWMRVDYYSARVLAFDNMQNRPIKGSTNWTKYEVVLFVPKDATSITYGVLLDGPGQIWFKDVKLEVADDSVPETGLTKGQEHKEIPFEVRAKAIADQIKKITEDEKNALKIEVDSLDNEVSKGIISKEKAEELKLNKAKVHAANIETNVAIEENKLSQLVQDRVDGKIETEDANKRKGTKIIIGDCNDCDKGDQTIINLTSMKVYHGQKDVDKRQSKRTTTQFVFAFGANNLVTDGQVAHSDFKYLQSHFYEWGITGNTRILKEDNLLHFKYGMSLMYNNLRATDDRYFEKNGAQTDLVTSPVHLDESRFRNVYVMVPLHLEFDFTKKEVRDGVNYFKSHKSARFGIGGYAGFRVKSKQILCFDDAVGNDVKQKTKGNFNVNDFNYGLSTYIGYKATSLYLKYDLQPLFEKNSVDQNNISLGLRFDFN
ncbi:hypothetical protein [Flavobacterium sharifuzzamanii]|uniref:hypothetical protein n=1 Tax=Flavobacterium sharifuzzamanii TaxID=2211133 RepID=UPI0013002FD3|nr:hypothetical protein [Flavobacterium sharifuzzamanii]KAF2082704.1 hypothetical protein DMA14_02075 [Flavobacterium sharifuzzamanii]